MFYLVKNLMQCYTCPVCDATFRSDASLRTHFEFRADVGHQIVAYTMWERCFNTRKPPLMKKKMFTEEDALLFMRSICRDISPNPFD